MEMQRSCCGGNGVIGACSCGLFHGPNSCLSMIWPPAPAVSSHQSSWQQYGNWDNQGADVYSVDCTLSLGTPSTRRTGAESRGGGGGGTEKGRHERRSSGCMTNFCWDMLQPGGGDGGNNQKAGGRSGGGGSVNGSGIGGGDSLLARRCANCDTTSTPLWRNGPRGPKSLCNACGIRYKKEERRATAAATTSMTMVPTAGGHQLYDVPSPTANYYGTPNSWSTGSTASAQYPQHNHKIQQRYSNEFRFVDDGDVCEQAGIPLLSWRLNVADRPTGLVHDFTR